MAYNFFQIDKGLSLKPQPAPPTNPRDGDLYYDSQSDNFRVYNGSEWLDIAASFLKPNIATDTATGTNAALSAISSGVVEITSGSLVSIGSIPAPSQSLQFILINRTGNAITIVNDTGTPAANRIKTGTGDDIVINNRGSLFLVYSENESRWIAVTGANFISNDAYGVSWNGINDLAPSQGAVYNKLETIENQITDLENTAYYLAIAL